MYKKKFRFDMTMLQRSTFVLLILSSALYSTGFFLSQDDPDAIVGVWMVGNKQGQVQIYKDGYRYFGKIIWLKNPLDPNTNQPRTDVMNPDPAKRDNPMVGLVNLQGLKYTGSNTWENGKLYDPEIGKEYSCTMTLRDENTLLVRGYVRIPLLGRNDIWRRVK